MAGIARRHPRKSFSHRPQPPLCKLPAELLLDIASYLPRSSLFCVAISCKHLWTTFSETETLPRSSQDKAEILKLIEKDYPTHVPCMVCMKFRRRRMTLPDQVTAEFISERPLMRDHTCVESAGAVHICNNFMIAFEHVQLVLRSQKFGAGHGIPITALDHSCNKMTIGISRPHAHEHAVTAKFIEGKLILRVQFSQTVDFAEDTFTQVKCFARHGCKHTYIDDSLAKMCESAVESAKTPSTTVAAPSTEDTAPINPPRCLYCATEFEILTTNTSSTSCDLTVNCYRDLGTANSPWSEVWQSQQGVFDNEKWPLNWEAHSWTHDSLKEIFDRGSSSAVAENNGGEEEEDGEKEAAKKEFAVLQLLRKERLRDPAWVRFYHGS